MLIIISSFYPRDIASALLATAMWLAGWLGNCPSVTVTRRYCIKMTTPILKLFRPSGSPTILVSSDPCRDTQFQGEPFSGGVKYTGVGKLAIFDGNRRLFRKRCETGRWLLWNVNVMGAGFNGIIFDDLEWPLTPISRSRHFSTLNISETTWNRATEHQ